MSAYKSAVVTGASGGIGRAIVDELVRLGMHVHALALPDTALDQLEGRDGVTVHGVDVRDTDALDEHLVRTSTSMCWSTTPGSSAT